MRLPSFRIRTLMIAVAIVAIVLMEAPTLLRGDGSPQLGFATVVACVGWLSVVAPVAPAWAHWWTSHQGHSQSLFTALEPRGRFPALVWAIRAKSALILD